MSSTIIYNNFNTNLTVGLFIYFIGLLGVVFNHKNFLITMMSIEIMYLGVLFLFIIVSVASNDYVGQIYSLIILVLAAAESAVGLGILIILHRFGNSTKFNQYQELRG